MVSGTVSLIVIQYGPFDLLLRLLTSLAEHPDRKLLDEIIVVDNGPSLSREARGRLKTMPLPVCVVENRRASSYAAGVNLGAAVARGNIFIIANNDVDWSSTSSIQPLLEVLHCPGVGITGPQLVYPDGRWQRSYGLFPSLREIIASLMMLDSLSHWTEAMRFHLGWNSTRPRVVRYVDGAFMAVQRACFTQVGGFDETMSMLEDTELSLRMGREKRGKIIIDKSLIAYNSARRFKQEGYLRVFLRYLKAYFNMFTKRGVKSEHFDVIDH